MTKEVDVPILEEKIGESLDCTKMKTEILAIQCQPVIKIEEIKKLFMQASNFNPEIKLRAFIKLRKLTDRFDRFLNMKLIQLGIHWLIRKAMLHGPYKIIKYEGLVILKNLVHYSEGYQLLLYRNGFMKLAKSFENNSFPALKVTSSEVCKLFSVRPGHSESIPSA